MQIEYNRGPVNESQLFVVTPQWPRRLLLSLCTRHILNTSILKFCNILQNDQRIYSSMQWTTLKKYFLIFMIRKPYYSLESLKITENTHKSNTYNTQQQPRGLYWHVSLQLFFFPAVQKNNVIVRLHPTQSGNLLPPIDYPSDMYIAFTSLQLLKNGTVLSNILPFFTWVLQWWFSSVLKMLAS